MSTITLPNIRVSSDLTVKVRLKDSGVAIDWSTLTKIKASIYSDAQRALAGRCDVSIDAEDSTLLVCSYAANKPQYVGVNRIVVSAKYMGETKTYDKPAFNFVRWTADQEGEEITIDDPDVDVEIDVEDVSSSILQEAVDAAFEAADRANDAAEAAEHMVDIHTGPEGKSAYEVAVEEGYTGTEEEWLASLKGDTGETPDINIGTVTTAEPGTPAAATMTGTPEDPVLNLTIPKGAVGATPNFTVGTVTTGAPGSSVIVTITGTAEAPVLNVTIPQGMQGNTGSSVDYPYELVNNLTTNDSTKGLSAAQGVVLAGQVSQLEQELIGLLGQRSYSVTQGTALNTMAAANRLDVQLKQGILYYLYFDYVEGSSLIDITVYLYYGSNTYTTITLRNRTFYCFLADQDYDYGIGLNLAAVSATADGTITISAYYKGLIRRIGDNEENIEDLIADKADTNKPFGNNLFDKDSTEILTNKYIDGKGNVVDGNTLYVSAPFLVKPGQSITANKVPSGTGFALYFDKDAKEYARIKVNGSGENAATLTNSKSIELWARVSFSATYKNTLMVNYGTTALPFEEYNKGTVIYDKTPDFLTCVEAARKVENLDYSRSYTVMQGTACNTTSNSNRLFAPMTAGHKLKVKVTYPQGAANGYYTVYFYTGNSYVTGTVTNGVEKEFIFDVDYDSIGFNIGASLAIADGTATINVNVQGEVEKLGDDVKDLQERVGVIEGSNLVRLSDVLYHWLNGEKFPIGFQGDSTTDGVSTTGWTVDNSHPAQDTAAGGRGKADYICELAYPKQLENLLRAELGSSTLRVYNIGYYGASLANNWNQLEDIYSDAYADVKMVGIVLGINDRGTATDAADFYNDVLTLLIQYVEFFIGKGITPFMVTNQVVTQCGNDPNTSSYSTLYEDYIQTLCNEAKRFVAKKYNLEIIDMNYFGRLLMESSSYSYDSITEDLHFKDLGHKLEAGFLFSQLIPWVNKTDNADKLHFGFNCAKCKTDFRIGSIETTTNDKFKLQVNTTQDSATDKCIFDAYMFNNSKNGAYTVKYLTPVASGYIVVDGDTANPIQITATEMNLGTWDIGLHHIQVYTGASTTVAFKGFLLESVS